MPKMCNSPPCNDSFTDCLGVQFYRCQFAENRPLHDTALGVLAAPSNAASKGKKISPHAMPIPSTALCKDHLFLFVSQQSIPIIRALLFTLPLLKRKKTPKKYPIVTADIFTWPSEDRLITLILAVCLCSKSSSPAGFGSTV